MKEINNNDLSRYALSVPRGSVDETFFSYRNRGGGWIRMCCHSKTSFHLLFFCLQRAGKGCRWQRKFAHGSTATGVPPKKEIDFFLIRAFWVTHTGSGPCDLFHFFFYWLFLFFEKKKGPISLAVPLFLVEEVK